MVRFVTLKGIAWTAALTACVAAAGQVADAGQSPAPRTPAFVQTALALDLAVDYDRPAIEGTAALTLLNGGGSGEREVPLLLNRLMSIRSIKDQSGRRLRWQSSVSVFEDDSLRQVVWARVTLAEPLPPGQRVTLRVGYGGPLVGYTETGSLYIKDRIDSAFTILRTDALAFPAVGVPSDRANRAMRQDDFAFDARIAVPESQVVATGGALVERTQAGNQVSFHFAGESVPFVNIAVAPYRVLEADGIRVYALPDDAARAETVLDAGRQALARLESWYGALPARPRVTVIEIPEGFGSQASLTGGIILGAAAFRDKGESPQFYHELSHFWNPRDLDLPSPRWNEGLATYLQFRLARELDGFTGTAAAVERARTRVCAPAVRAELDRVPFQRFGAERATDHAYRVGFLMFTALETLLGPGPFDAGVREYVQAHLAQGGTTSDFISVMSRASASLKLEAFFRDWMETSAWTSPVCSAATFPEALDRWRE
jgi:hypothetical protein